MQPAKAARPGPRIRVLIADDHAVVREGIRQVLSGPEFDVVGEAGNGEDAVGQALALKPDVLVLDLSMPGLGGLEAAARLRGQAPETRILVLSIHDDEEYVLQSVRAGAQGYLRKDSTPAELRDAIRAVHEGAGFFSAPVARSLSSALQAEQKMAGLTVREREVLLEIARGGTSKEIAHLLGISVRTVEAHRDSLMRKLGLRGVAALTRFAIETGLLR